jgi:hypothetical protein
MRKVMDEPSTAVGGQQDRRKFLKKGVAVAGAAALGAGLLSRGVLVLGAEREDGPLTKGDAAILRFLAAAEILETDLWQQYNELGGVNAPASAYQTGLLQLDGDMPQYIADNTDDEFSHESFLNAYLHAKGAQRVNLEKFRTLLNSKITKIQGFAQKKRLTNLTELTVDTSWWVRYRSEDQNPDFGDAFLNAVPTLATGQFPAIPRDDGELGIGITATPVDNHVQAIANTAGFHFAFIEQGGTSLYPSLAQRVKSVEVLRILLSIGPTETAHFQTWHDKAGNAVALTDGALTFPDLRTPPQPESLQANLIMPEPTIFLDRKFPRCSIIRPTATKGVAMGAVKALTDDGLFIGQSNEFFDVLHQLAEGADEAKREL